MFMSKLSLMPLVATGAAGLTDPAASSGGDDDGSGGGSGGSGDKGGSGGSEGPGPEGHALRPWTYLWALLLAGELPLDGPRGTPAGR